MKRIERENRNNSTHIMITLRHGGDEIADQKNYAKSANEESMKKDEG